MVAVATVTATIVVATLLSGCGHGVQTTAKSTPCSRMAQTTSSGSRQVVRLTDNALPATTTTANISLGAKSTVTILVIDPKCVGANYTISQQSGRVVGVSITRQAPPPDSGASEALIVPLRLGHSSVQIWVDPQPACPLGSDCVRPASRLLGTVTINVGR